MNCSEECEMTRISLCLCSGIKGALQFLWTQPGQMKYIEWPSVKSTVRASHDFLRCELSLKFQNLRFLTDCCAGEDGASDASSRHVSHGFPLHSGLPFPASTKEQHEADRLELWDSN